MWTSEAQDEYAEAMADPDRRQREEAAGPGLLVLIDGGELDMEALVSLFS